MRLPLSAKDAFGSLVGRSVPMRRMFEILERVAGTDATVLMEGETGTGKEAAAESLHRESARRDGPFVVVDCAAIPSELLESELFGHERGAFTGATTARTGVFEMASGGTLFLDEIGELSLDLQPKLLRALESREIKRVGGDRAVPVDVRIVAATNRSLRAEVNDKRFRSDLYYRLAVVELRLPPLRERAEDLPLLVEALLSSLGASHHPESKKLRSAPFLADLGRHAWPGNVRELRNYMERCIALGETAPLGAESSGPIDGLPDLKRPLKVAREQWTRAFERRYVEGMLQKHDNNVTAAAREAGVDRMYFYRLLWRYGLR
jgi:transcriptional regulator with PAS, ATPase and Fis domain